MRQNPPNGGFSTESLQLKIEEWSMNRAGDDLLLQSLERQEDYIHTAADAIDAKAGLILAGAAFLAVQPAVLLIVPNIPKCIFVVQLASFLCICSAVWFAHCVLAVKEYWSPGLSESWRDKQIAAAQTGATEEFLIKTILWGLIEHTKIRVLKGKDLNESKLVQLARARKFLTAAFFINVAIISIILMSDFF
jgi:hypothetical protein